MEWHEAASIFPMLEQDKLDELAADIAEHGLREPIVLYGGKILDGRNRFRACGIAKVKPHFSEYDGDDPIGFVLSLNRHRRHLSASQLAAAAVKAAELYEKFRKENEQWQRDAGRLGGRPKTNESKTLASAEAKVSYAANKTSAKVAEEFGVSRASVERAMAVAKEAPDLIEKMERNEISTRGAYDEMKRRTQPHVVHNSGENEWYTPPEFIEAAREAMGGIDLDPASSDTANATVQAKAFFTKDDCGLTKEWSGRVWMNPPYAQPLIRHFAEKLCDEYDAGHIDAACVLVNNATETGWFQSLATAATAICFPSGRVRFLDPQGNPGGSPLQGQAVLYFGRQQKQFMSAFNGFGVVATIKRKELPRG